MDQTYTEYDLIWDTPKLCITGYVTNQWHLTLKSSADNTSVSEQYSRALVFISHWAVPSFKVMTPLTR